jgi:tetratricopeptide (TPR) repeat protein
MLDKKISIRSGVILFFALTLVLAGCTPAGPRALLKGKKYLDSGDTAAAVTQLERATQLLVTNAAAWNYYGVALQRASQPDAAVTAYQRALDCNRELQEVHFNLGSLWLEQNKLDVAKTEFTAYTLRRNNDPAGWLKLGSTQLRLGEIVPAERSFSTVLALHPNDEQAYNGLGLARMQRNRPQEAVKFFAAAKEQRPDFAAAILNLATTSQQYLRDNKTALENYRAYLALKPRAANWDEVNALANSLEQALAPVAPVPALVAKVTPPVVTPATETKTQPKPTTVAATRPPVTRPQPAPVKVVATTPTPKPTVVIPPPQVVQVQPAPVIVTTPPKANPVVAVAEPIEVPMPEPVPEKKTGFWKKLFGPEKTANPSGLKSKPSGITPLPPPSEPDAAPTKVLEPAPEPVKFARYNYNSPRRPAAGNRASANGAFTQARIAEQGEKWLDALQAYKQASEIDPAWFEAQYNTGVLAHRLRNYPLALPSYENALAIQPDSSDARYNFSLALKAAGYPVDAADELKKILASDNSEVRAHLALANLCAQSLHDTTQARQHYLKVLELEPKNPQASDIRFWLSGNAK